MKILNLYAGIGGNRKLWGDEHEITSVEYEPHIAEAYATLYPNDTVVVADAHQYLLDHYKEYDFIWSSPPCPTHSRMNLNFEGRGIKLKYLDMTLYQEIIFLKHFCSVPWVVENVIAYYDPLIPPTRELARHYFWTNYHLDKFYSPHDFNLTQVDAASISKLYGIELPESTKNARKLLRNAVIPELGLHVFENRDLYKQVSLL